MPWPRRFKIHVFLLLFVLSVTANSLQLEATSPNPRGLPPPWDWLRPTFYDNKLTDLQKKILYPSPEYEAAFASFLRAKNSGLFRLLPKGKYEFGPTVASNRDPNTILPVLGGGAYYSFTERSHKFGPWSDIGLWDNHLVASPASKSIGIITSLGNVPLESVTVDSPGLAFLVSLIPPKTYEGVTDLHRRVTKGIESSGFKYGAAFEATPGLTYALRSITYKRDGYVVYPNDPYTRLDPSKLGYDGSDIVIAFRILQRNDDGSLEILWRRLERFKNPSIKGEPARNSFNSVKQLIQRKLPPGSSTAEVLAFLDLNGIEHSAFIGPYHDENAPRGTTGLINATIPGIDRTVRVMFDLYVQFYFNDRKDLIECGFTKVRK